MLGAKIVEAFSPRHLSSRGVLGPVRDGGFHNREWDSEKMSMQLSHLPMPQRHHPQNCTVCDSRPVNVHPKLMSKFRFSPWRGCDGAVEGHEGLWRKRQDSP